MIRVILAIWIYLGSLATALISGSVITQILAAYPKDHFRTFGARTPAISEAYARWLPHAPAALGIVAIITIVVALYFWRSIRSRDTKTFVVVFAAALNYFLSCFCLLALVTAYFLLPKLANSA